MKRSIGSWQFLGFAVTSLAGTVLHFLYDWLNNSVLIAPFSGVNESTWEHMKLLFWPMFVFAIIEYFFFKELNEFWCVKLSGIALGLTMIPILFYTYKGVIGKSADFVNIAIFFISAAISYIWETKRFKSNKTACCSPKFAFVTLLLIALLFCVFTFFTPEIGIFEDPLTGTYGI
jgi:hypothetical protein